MNPQELCLSLMRADSEEEVVQILTNVGLWDDPLAWRHLGDDENNFAPIGNQQSEAVAAIIEKLVNSIDHRLTNACLERGEDPTSESSPRSIREAVARYYEEKDGEIEEGDGRLSNWPDRKITAEGRVLTLAATGFEPESGRLPCLSIADQGEGQTPDDFPTTFMSLHRSNKLRIHFVQGKFNMGGTGVLQFCSPKHRLQLIVSRRNPRLLPPGAPARDHEWGFTIVRRERLADGGRNSVFNYLAPVGAAPGKRGEVLSVPAATLPIFPDAKSDLRDAYHRPSEHGSLVKLYEFEWRGTKSNIVQSGGGLLRLIDAGLPELALPVRVYECRPGYKGKDASFSTNVLGIVSRLEANKAANLEVGFPSASVLNIEGHTIKVRVYAFQKDKAKAYRLARHAIIYTVNGQSHATASTDFFRRNKVGMNYLAESLLVVVDCSEVDEQMREDLFMNSRDRLRDTPLSRSVERELESLLNKNEQLKTLRMLRREAELEDKLEGSKPLAQVLAGLLKKQPTLAKLFLRGVTLPSPAPNAAGAGSGTAGEFKGKPFPTFFRFRNKKDGEPLSRGARLGTRPRIAFETDADNDYFVRDLSQGICRVLMVDDQRTTELLNWTMNGPSDGVASLVIELPDDAAEGQELRYRVEVTDPTMVSAFVNELTLKVVPATNDQTGGKGKGKIRNTGTGNSGGTASLALPNMKEVEAADYQRLGFNELTALRIVGSGEGGADAAVYDFYINIDNKYLKIAQRESKQNPALLKSRYLYANVLFGMAMIQDAQNRVGGDNGEDRFATLEADVERTTKALSPVLLPLLELMVALDDDDDEGS